MNELLTDEIIAKEALMIVENNLQITRLINRRWEGRFAQEGKKIGDHLDIRLPVRWEGREGEAMIIEGAKETTVTLKIDKLIGQDLSFSNVDLTLKIEQFRERYLETASAAIANRIDAWIAEGYIDCPNFAGAPGTVPSSLDTYFDASVVLSNYGVPTNSRSVVLSPRMEATIVNALKGLFQAAQAIAEQYKTGSMGHVIGFDWYMDQNMRNHTVGPLGGAPTVNGAGQSGSTVITANWTAAAANRLKKGDVLTFGTVTAGSLGVNPQPPRDSTGELRQVVVTEDVDSDGAGAAVIPIFPAIKTAGPYKNVSQSPPNGAAVLTFGHASNFASKVTRQGMAFHKEWMTAAFVDLDLPGGMEMSARAKSRKLNISIRIVKGYDIKTNQQLCRLDVLCGKKQTYEDFGCRIAS
ncbi:MAG: P22 phage major capsid protein family protein [Vicinamibacterales bacterium]